MHFINGRVINGKITAKGSRLDRFFEAGHSDMRILGEFYLVAFSRHPSEEESESWRAQLSTAADGVERKKLFEDFLWAMLSSREFTTNH